MWLTDLLKDSAFSGMLLICVLPVIVICICVWVCKKYNIKILPEGMRNNFTNTEFKMPKVSRKAKEGRFYKWEVEEDNNNSNNSNKSYVNLINNSTKNLYD